MRFYNTGRYRPINPDKYIGDKENIIYRSSWELKAMQHFDRNTNILQWSSEELIIRYISPLDHKPHRYFPDFLIHAKTPQGIQSIIIEVKPLAQTIEPIKKKRVTKKLVREVTTWAVNQAKWQAAKDFCEPRGWKFQLLTERELGIKR